MPQARTPEAVTREFVDIAFDQAYEMREAYDGYLKRRKANREQLRSLEAQGFLNDEQKAELEELYPKRQTKDDEAEEAAAEDSDDAGETE